jgi:exonuclease III
MIGFTILSHNIQGKFSLFEEELNRFIGERPLNVACLQDVGYIGPDGPIAWKDHANTDRIFTNYSNTNKSRNVAILVGSDWDISKVEKSKGGGLLAVTLHHDLITLKVISAYLPPGLDSYGKPDSLPSGESVMATRQKEALDSYHTLTEWAQDVPNWVLVGDLNETRDEKLDRTVTEKMKPSRKRRKFVEEFLSSTGAIDMWRATFPNAPNGHTRRDPSSHSTARLDYIVASSSFYSIKSWQKQIWLGGFLTLIPIINLCTSA